MVAWLLNACKICQGVSVGLVLGWFVGCEKGYS